MRHGTSTAYIHGKCRCEECRAYMRRYNKKLRLDTLRGVSRQVEAEPVHRHIAALKAAGMSHNAITIAAGYRSRNSLDSILRQTLVSRRVFDRIMAVRPESETRGTAYVDATGARRRLQALCRMGWTTRALAQELGRRDHSTVLDIINGASVVRSSTHAAIGEMYERCWGTDGGSERTRRWASGKGWAMPAEWDDIDTDAEPHASQRGREVAHRDIADVLEDFRDTLAHHGGDVVLAADRLGMRMETLERALWRARAAGHDVKFARGRVVA